MITDAILKALAFPIMLLLDAVPKLDLGSVASSGIIESGKQLLSGIGYVLPMGALMPILVASLAIDSFRFIWYVVIRVKSFIPLMGN
jgi:hypothetical protein